MSELQKIAFIGLGIMGAPIARNLMKAGFELHVWARRREKAQPLLAEGAVWYDSAAEAARSADAVITMLGVCGVRLFWIFVVFPQLHSFQWLMAIYPISLGITMLLIFGLLLYCRPSRMHEAAPQRV